MITSSHQGMLFLWTGCIVLGSAYLLFFYDESKSSAFIFTQIVLGVLGILREIYIKKNYLDKEQLQNEK